MSNGTRSLSCVRVGDIDVSRRSSKQLAQPSAQSVPPAKLATLQSQGALASQKDDASSGSSPRSEGTCRVMVVRLVSVSLMRVHQTPLYPPTACLLGRYLTVLHPAVHQVARKRGSVGRHGLA